MRAGRLRGRSARGSACALLGLLLGACGGQAQNPDGALPRASASGAANATPSGAGVPGFVAGSGNTPNSEAGQGGSASSDAGQSGSASAAGSLTQPQGGQASQLPAARPCDSPSPRPRGGGYSVCADGSLRRPSAAACEAALPRPAPDLPFVSSECSNDSDCASQPHGFCAYGACKYGCVVDDECPSDTACFCGAAIGVCIPAGCRSDADCPSGFPCTAFQAPGFAMPDALSCQSPTDACVTDAQCNSSNPRVSCKVQGDHRICYQDTVG